MTHATLISPSCQGKNRRAEALQLERGTLEEEVSEEPGALAMGKRWGKMNGHIPSGKPWDP
jgi:hypothetical protein